MEELFDLIDRSKTAYNAVETARDMLLKAGFKELYEHEAWNVTEGGKYFVIRDSSALIAFTAGKENGYVMAASHCDSPCFKLKGNPEITEGKYVKYNVEPYGGGIYYSFLDTPLTVAGRISVAEGNTVEALPFVSSKTFVIPSLAIHFSRTVNDGVKLNPQTDMSPLASLGGGKGLADEMAEFAGGREVADCDLFLVSAQKPFAVGYAGNLFSAPRIDNLTSVFASVEALICADGKATNVAYIADNEEIGSRTKQGAGSAFLYDTLRRINRAMGKGDEDLDEALANSIMISCDNAHACHPNRPSLSDPTNTTYPGGGVVIKHHAMGNYTSDGFSSALFRHIMGSAGVKCQDFFMRSDLPCGGTLGTISSSHVSVRSVDIGIAQLAMHSCVETASLDDYDELVRGLTAAYSCFLRSRGPSSVTVE